MMAELLALLRVPEVRRRLAVTAVLVAVYRMGFWLPLPLLNQAELSKQVSQGAMGELLSVLAVVTASDIGSATIFGLGVMPYISASILFQLLGQVYPALAEMQKEGESGRRKINEYTRYATIVLCYIQSFVWLSSLSKYPGVVEAGASGFGWVASCALVMTAGTAVLMWLGEQIDAFGLGGGVSLLMVVGIIARLPVAVGSVLDPFLREGVRLGGDSGAETVLLLLVGFVAIVAGVVVLNSAQRRIPVESSKQRSVSGGGQSLPLKLNQSGVMPVIFASSLLMLPGFVFEWLSARINSPWIQVARESFASGTGLAYLLSFVLLVYFFSFFWTSVAFNPKQVADGLRDSGVFVPGYRPGPRTEEFLERVVIRVTVIGATGLIIVAVLPNLVSSTFGVGRMLSGFYGGTGLLIVASVVLDLRQKLKSYRVFSK
jgi:preprotein translocase subunit SecY